MSTDETGGLDDEGVGAPEVVEAVEAAERAEDAAERADNAAGIAQEAAEDAGESAESAAALAEKIDNSTDLVVSPDAPAYVQPVRVQHHVSLLRHSPFNIGFFGALGVLLAVFLIEQLFSISSILVLLVLAMFLAIGLNPVVEWFMRRGVRRGLSVLMVLTVVIGVLVLFIGAVAPVISEQIALITRNAPGWFSDLQRNTYIQQLDERFDVIDKMQDYVTNSDFTQRVFGGALGVGLAVLSAVTNTFIVLVLMIYFLASLPSIKHAGYSLAPASRRPRVSELGDKIIRSTGAYVSGAFLVAVCAGISTLVFTWVVGLGDYSFALAFIVGLLSLIPVLGAVVSGVIMTLLALTVSPTVALVAAIYYIAYQQVESYLISPRIMKRAVDIPGAVTVIAALIGGSLMGIIGALLAVPVAAALLLLHREVFLKRQDSR
ncbi:AI-2E family transporter [Nocardioides oleivorans]|uniref:AI-2E family transporter n=1 Tax=Nocardioides oleivorans TaxID=273676 RepID=A0A4Q2RT12_9ACTN|nr:AI-2E family transporter [Nocardioides oleivorans]